MVWHTHTHTQNKSDHFRGINLSNAVLLTVNNCKCWPRAVSNTRKFSVCVHFYHRAVWLCVLADSHLCTDGKEPSFLISTVALQCNPLWQFCACAFYVPSVVTYIWVLKIDRDSSNHHFSRRAWSCHSWCLSKTNLAGGKTLPWQSESRVTWHTHSSEDHSTRQSAIVNLQGNSIGASMTTSSLQKQWVA
jgi:hypothetical protein